MELSILSDSNDPNTGRRDIAFSVVQDDKTSSREEVKGELCKRLNISPDTTIITDIKQEFGVRRSMGTAHSYGTKEQLERSEPKYLLERLSKRAKKQQEGTPPKEGPKQEKKEDAKEEKQKEKAKEKKPKGEGAKEDAPDKEAKKEKKE